MFSNIEKNILKKYQFVAGLDEAGRGCLAGPVAAAGVVISSADFQNGIISRFCKRAGIREIRNSKRLSRRRREEIFEAIKAEPAVKWRVSFVSPRIIDRINIWQATILGWKRCLKKMDFPPDFVFLDGKLSIPRLETSQQAVVKGDDKIFLVSLASVVAKVSRDCLIERASLKYPSYGLERHKGYGTKFHLEKLNQFGPCAIHRRSFGPVLNS